MVKIFNFDHCDLFNSEMTKAFNETIDRFYTESNFIKDIRSYIKELAETNVFKINSNISVANDKVCETYYFYFNGIEKPFMSFVLKGYLITALHRRIISKPKALDSFNRFVNSVKENVTKDCIDNLIKLFTVALAAGGSSFMLDTCEEYFVLEAMKSKLTAEFMMY